MTSLFRHSGPDSASPPDIAEARRSLVLKTQRLRGACVLAVMAIHVTGGFTGRTTVDWFTAVLIAANGLVRFAVPIFVLLSGLSLSLSPRNERPLPFYRRTLKLLLVPYVVYSGVYTVLQLADKGSLHLSAWRATVRSFAGLWFWNLRYASAQYHLWFIPVIIGLYLCHPFLRRWYRRSAHPGRLLALAFVVQLACGLAQEFLRASPLRGKWLELAGVGLSLLPLLGYFVLGYYLFDHAGEFVVVVGQRRTRVAALAAWVTTAALIACCWIAPIFSGKSFQEIRLPYLPHVLLSPFLSAGALVVLLAWFSQSRDGHPFNRFVQVCGLYAYGLYYVHPLLLRLVSAGLTTVVRLDANSPWSFVWQFPLCAIGSLFVVKCLARLPYSRYLL